MRFGGEGRHQAPAGRKPARNQPNPRLGWCTSGLRGKAVDQQAATLGGMISNLISLPVAQDSAENLLLRTRGQKRLDREQPATSDAGSLQTPPSAAIGQLQGAQRAQRGHVEQRPEGQIHSAHPARPPAQPVPLTKHHG